MKILITGAKGMLGMELWKYLENIGYFVIPTDKDILDVTDSKLCNEVIQKTKPDLIIHSAGYTDVEKAQDEYEKAYEINTLGTKNIAIEAQNINATLIYISTDYVFDGNKNSPYLANDEPNPTNNYGKTKLLGEKEVIKNCQKYYITRTSWLYGEYGENFISKIISLSKTKKEIKVVDSQIGSPTWTFDFAQNILKVLNKPYGIYHLSNQGETSWYNYAKEIFKRLNISTELIPCNDKDYTQKAKRPKYSTLGDSLIEKTWQQGLGEYLTY